MRILDVLLAFPSLLLAMVILATIGPSKFNLILVITLVYIPMFARITRSVVLDLRTREFVEAARLRGERRSYILFREMLPNAMSPLLVEDRFASPTRYFWWLHSAFSVSECSRHRRTGACR